MSEAAVPAATEAMLANRRSVLDAGARPLGWKVGFNVPAIQEKLGIESPLAGFLSSAGLLSDGSTLRWTAGPRWPSRRWPWRSGTTAARSSRCSPRWRWPTRPTSRGTWSASSPGTSSTGRSPSARGWRPTAPGAARVLVNGEEREQVPAERTGAHLEAMVAAVADRLAAAGASLSPGERIITGVLAPPPAVEAGDVVRLELESLGAVELSFS